MCSKNSTVPELLFLVGLKMAATAETCIQVLPNCNYCMLFDVCCVLTVRNILYECVCFASISRVAADAQRRILVSAISQRGVMKAAPLGPFLSKGSHANTEGPDCTLKSEFTFAVVRNFG